MSLQSGRPAARKQSTSAAMSLTMTWMPFQPPEVGWCPSGIAVSQSSDVTGLPRSFRSELHFAGFDNRRHLTTVASGKRRVQAAYQAFAYLTPTSRVTRQTAPIAVRGTANRSAIRFRWPPALGDL